MKVFISWKGQASLEAAKVLREFIPRITPGVEPFVSDDDIPKGRPGVQKILDELEESSFGILCFTPSNTNSLWMMFESGAIVKSVNKSKLAPVLFSVDIDKIRNTPIFSVGFQATRFSKPEFRKLFASLNESLDSKRQPNDVFEDLFEAFWPKLEEKIRSINFLAVEGPVLEELSSLPGIASPQPLEGLWLSQFKYKTSKGSEFWDGSQIGLEILKATSQDESLTGKNILIESTSNKYFHKTKGVIHGNFIVGYWSNTNTTNVGCFQLTISSNYNLLDGLHLGNANDNSIQSGDWKWVRILNNTDITITEIEGSAFPYELIGFEELEIFLTESTLHRTAINLSDILREK